MFIILLCVIFVTGFLVLASKHFAAINDTAGVVEVVLTALIIVMFSIRGINRRD